MKRNLFSGLFKNRATGKIKPEQKQADANVNYVTQWRKIDLLLNAVYL